MPFKVTHDKINMHFHVPNVHPAGHVLPSLVDEKDAERHPPKPDRTTMLGMIWRANRVLDAALDPGNFGIPKDLFERCHGIALLSIVTAGFVVSGHGGSGVLLAKKRDENGNLTNEWSPPSALGLVGYGGGAIAGADVKSLLIFIMDEKTMADFATRVQTRFSAQVSITAGKHGRETDIGHEAPDHGTISVNFNKGIFGGVSVELGTLGVRQQANNKFYGYTAKPKDVLFGNKVVVPPDCGVEELHHKLELLTQGKTWVPSAVDDDVTERHRKRAVRAGEKAREEQKEEIEDVDTSVKSSISC